MDTALRFCPVCLSRGWVLAQRHRGDGEWEPCKALCPTCAGLSVHDVDALRDQAADEHWLKRRYTGTEASCWDEYDWAREQWADARGTQRAAS